MPASRQKKPPMKRLRCAECQGVRLHTTGPIRTAAGFVLAWTCSACCRAVPAGGVCCRECGSTNLGVESRPEIRYTRVGAIVRVRKCLDCPRGRCRTVERPEAWLEPASAANDASLCDRHDVSSTPA